MSEQAKKSTFYDGCALLDATQARKYRIRGADAGAFLDYVVTRSMTNLPLMRATYGIWCGITRSRKHLKIACRYWVDGGTM